jgi:1-aminocyclopropane-1-carboxylate deaminase/D-cysteine desulfhydrase-like pyridoxal-dependent ACC family enzyme
MDSVHRIHYKEDSNEVTPRGCLLMDSPALFRKFPHLTGAIPWVRLCPPQTSVGRLSTLGTRLHHPSLYIKREDETDTTYGGNKVRNLEFVLGQAIQEKSDRVLTMAPLGSNFIAAFAAQTKRLGLKAQVEHFVMVRNPQVDAHARFSQAYGAELNIYRGLPGIVAAASSSFSKMAFSRTTHWCPPGGSNLTGALGHANAALELAEQVKNGEMPVPDVVIVGAGTCGTIAGLSAGFRVAGFKTRVIGVRCVDPVVCNGRTVARLANAVLERVGSNERISPSQVELYKSPLDSGYGIPLQRAEALKTSFYEMEGIHLDTTYTTKVVSKLSSFLDQGAFKNQTVLYWHTFSPAAMLYDRPILTDGPRRIA